MANIPTTSWDETSPSGSNSVNAGDNRIRELKTQLREVIAVDHDMDSSGQDTNWGQHKQVTLQEQADLGTGAVGATILGSQTVSGKGELVYTDEDDNDVQITSSGYINTSGLNAGALPTGITVASANIVDGTIVNADINASAAIAPTKLASGIDAAQIADGSMSNTEYQNLASIAAQLVTRTTTGYGGADAIVDWYDFPNTVNDDNLKAHGQAWTPTTVEVLAKEGSSGTTIYKVSSSNTPSDAQSLGIGWNSTNVILRLRNLSLRVPGSGGTVTFTDPYIKILLYK